MSRVDWSRGLIRGSESEQRLSCHDCIILLPLFILDVLKFFLPSWLCFLVVSCGIVFNIASSLHFSEKQEIPLGFLSQSARIGQTTDACFQNRDIFLKEKQNSQEEKTQKGEETAAAGSGLSAFIMRNLNTAALIVSICLHGSSAYVANLAARNAGRWGWASAEQQDSYLIHVSLCIYGILFHEGAHTLPLAALPIELHWIWPQWVWLLQ